MTEAEGAAVVETHGAVIFFVGDIAFKMKKPVKFSFMDFSTPEKRRLALDRELELNRRIAPDVYLDVVDLVGSDGKAVDSMLVMKRMPDERRLSELIRHSAGASPCIEKTARVLAAFHELAGRSEEIASAATPSALRAQWDANSAEMAPFEGSLLPAENLARLDLAHRYIDGRGPLFEARIAAGKICDGHGDLLATDIFCLDDGPRILDCIEFDEAFRWCDVLSDAAFLAMDFERLGHGELAKEFFGYYHRYSGDSPPASLVDLYIAYRAQVRSKVACLRHAQGGDDAEASAEEAARLLEICIAHLDKSRVRLVLVGGLPGTGKSTIAAQLSDTTGWPVIRSDVVRKELAGIPPGESRAAAMGAGIYSPEMTAITYEAMYDEAATLMGLGESVILDATFSAAEEREAAAEIARDAIADLIELRCSCPRELAIARASSRRGDASDAGGEVASTMEFDPWLSAVEIDTTTDGLPSALSAL